MSSVYSVDRYVMYFCSSDILMTAVFSKIITEQLKWRVQDKLMMRNRVQVFSPKLNFR